MSAHANPNMITDGLVAYFDVNNSRCVDASQTITADTRLNNLIKGGLDIQMRPYDVTNGNMTFVEENGIHAYDQNGINGGEPCWYSTSLVTPVNDYTFITWFKYNYGSEYQRTDNIYGGGFEGATSFVLSWGGTSNSPGILRYTEGGSTNYYSHTSDSYGGNDGEWHMFAATDTGGDGAHTTRFFVDGVFKGTGTSNADHDTPDSARSMTWGSWSKTYGNFNGRTNCYMYYERTLTDEEIMENFVQMKSRFIRL